MNNQPIGILDSGVGGLTVWQKIVSQLPNESTVYIGDSLNAPYGLKNRDEILALASRMIEFLLSHHVKLIVVACNTITVSGIDVLRKKYSHIPIVGTVPVIKTAVATTTSNTIGVLSTVVTAESAYQKSLIAQYAAGKKVINRGTNKLVPLIEKGVVDTEEIEAILTEELAPFQKKDIDVLALGCTHFPFLINSMQEILGQDVLLLDSGGAIARQVRKILEHNTILSQTKKTSHTLFSTGDVRVQQRLVGRMGIRDVTFQRTYL